MKVADNIIQIKHKLRFELNSIRRQIYFKYRPLKFFYQRLTRGWDDSVTWNLDSHLAKLMVPLLKRFKELHRGYPGAENMGPEEWNKILDEMIFAFAYHASEDKYFKHYPDEYYDRVNNGRKLFAEWFGHLWW